MQERYYPLLEILALYIKCISRWVVVEDVEIDKREQALSFNRDWPVCVDVSGGDESLRDEDNRTIVDVVNG